MLGETRLTLLSARSTRHCSCSFLTHFIDPDLPGNSRLLGRTTRHGLVPVQRPIALHVPEQENVLVQVPLARLARRPPEAAPALGRDGRRRRRGGRARRLERLVLCIARLAARV